MDYSRTARRCASLTARVLSYVTGINPNGLVGLHEACRLLFFFQAEDGIRDVAVTGVQTCALPILGGSMGAYYGRVVLSHTAAALAVLTGASAVFGLCAGCALMVRETHLAVKSLEDRKSTRLNSSHGYISYAVFCLKKKNKSHWAAHTHTTTAR